MENKDSKDSKDKLLQSLENLVLALENATIGSRLGENELSNMIKDLQKAIEEKEPTQGAMLQVDDHKETISKYLTEEAANAMKTKYKGLHLYEDGQLVAQCVYFSLVVRSEKIEDGLAEIAKIANTLAERGLIKAVLYPPSSLRLARIPLQAPVSAVFFFPLVPVNMVKEIKRDYKYSIEEGSVGEYFGSVAPYLKPGEFLVATRISTPWKMHKAKEFDVSGELVNIINAHLRIFPPGTEFLGATNCAIVDLSIPYELNFYNPMLSDVKSAQLDFTRYASVVNEKLVEDSIITGVHYFDADGKELFKY